MKSPSDSSSPKIDLAGLTRRVLAEQQPGEDVDAALERIAQSEFPEDREKIVKMIEQFLSWRQKQLGVSRAEAAELMAQSMAQLTIGPDGELFLKELDLKQQGLETLAPEQRQQLQEQIEQAFREGKPLPIIRMEDLKPESRQQLLQLVERSLREGKPMSAPIIAGPAKVEVLDFNLQGMEKLPPEFKLQIQQQIEEAVCEGKPIPTEITVSPLMLGKLIVGKVPLGKLLILAALLLALLVYLLFLR